MLTVSRSCTRFHHHFIYQDIPVNDLPFLAFGMNVVITALEDEVLERVGQLLLHAFRFPFLSMSSTLLLSTD